jgi:hypothetical protein
MPLDSTGAPAPRTLTDWVQHLKRRKIAGGKARGAVTRQRAATKQRLAIAEHLIADIIASGDVVAQGSEENRWGNAEPVVFVLLTLHSALFNHLAIFGSELEDLEDTNDAERDEHTGELEADRADEEPSLGATEISLSGGVKFPELINSANTAVVIPPGVFAPGGVYAPSSIRCGQTAWGASGVDDREWDPVDHGEPDADDEADYRTYGRPR